MIFGRCPEIWNRTLNRKVRRPSRDQLTFVDAPHDAVS